jgi:SAM-dependent methyltransferase
MSSRSWSPTARTASSITPWTCRRGQFHQYIGHVDCTGKRASGFLSFSAEGAGAREVVSFDMDHGGRQHLLPFVHKEYYQDHPGWVKKQTADVQKWHNAYWLAHRTLGSRAKVYHGDVYDLPAELGQFDVVIVGAVLEHLSDPIRALASIARRCSDKLVISTDLVFDEEPMAKFMGRAGHPKIDFVFWVYSLGTYRHVLAILGFEIERTETYEFKFRDVEKPQPRTAIVARRICE